MYVPGLHPVLLVPDEARSARAAILKGSRIALPPQPGHRNVATASSGKCPTLLPPSEFSLLPSRKRRTGRGLRELPTQPVPEKCSLWAKEGQRAW